MADTTLVDDLISDAKLVAGYGQRAGLFEDDQLFVAISRVERLPADERLLSCDEMVELQREFNRSRKIVPFGVLAALRNGWSPLVISRSLSLSVVLCVVLSIVLMTVVGRLTFVYNQGRTLLVDIERLQSQGYEQRFGQLERRLIAAMGTTPPPGPKADPVAPGADAGTPPSPAPQPPAGNPQADVEQMAVNNYYDMLSEIKSLDRTIDDVGSRSRAYVQAASYPLPLMQTLHRKLSALSGSTEAYTDVPPDNVVKVAPEPPERASATAAGAGGTTAVTPTAAQIVYEKNSNCALANGQYKAKVLPGDPSSAFGSSIRRDIEHSFGFACANGLTHTAAFMPPLEQWKVLIRDLLDPYLYWILPSLYGALGAMLFFMRSILDPLQPNPRWVRIIHRMALGALAGIIVAWFWQPLSVDGGELQNAGFGPFTFAFIAGFSMDIFFALLDRLVAVSVATIGRIGNAA